MQNSEIDQLVFIEDGKAITDSIKLAYRFGKAHKTVLRAYDNLQCSSEFNRRNYVPIEYPDKKGRRQRAISMTKDGFAMLAMGFTGKEATKFKEDYIAQFNAMQEAASGDQQGLWIQMQALVAKEVSSQVKASFGSHLMLQRKKEIPPLRTERQILEAAIQPSLLN